MNSEELGKRLEEFRAKCADGLQTKCASDIIAMVAGSVFVGEIALQLALLNECGGNVRRVPVGTRRPDVGPWDFDSQAPSAGYRNSDNVPVIVCSGGREEFAWAQYVEATADGGKTVSERSWVSDDDLHHGLVPTFWLEIMR